MVPHVRHPARHIRAGRGHRVTPIAVRPGTATRVVVVPAWHTDPDTAPCDACSETGIAPDNPAADCDHCAGHGYLNTDGPAVSVDIPAPPPRPELARVAAPFERYGWCGVCQSHIPRIGRLTPEGWLCPVCLEVTPCGL